MRPADGLGCDVWGAGCEAPEVLAGPNPDWISVITAATKTSQPARRAARRRRVLRQRRRKARVFARGGTTRWGGAAISAVSIQLGCSRPDAGSNVSLW